MPTPQRDGAASVSNLPTPKANNERGVSASGIGLGVFGSWGEEVQNLEKGTVAEIQKMLKRDGQARGIYRFLTLPILSALQSFEITPGDGDKGEAEFCKQMLSLPPAGGGMTVSLNMFMRKLLLSIRDGYSAFEVVTHIPTTGPLAGKWTIRKLAHRPADTVTFLTDDSGNYNGFKQRTSFKGKAIDEKFEVLESFYFAVNEEENPFYGVSPLLPVFYHYDKKIKLYYIAHIAAQLAATGLRIGKIPETADPKDITEFKSMLHAPAFNTSWTVPAGFIVEVQKLGGDMAFFDTLFKHHNLQMARSALVNFTDSNERPVLIDNADNAPEDIFIMSQEALIHQLEETITNHLLARYVAYNFKDPVYPTFKFGELTDSARNAFRTLFAQVFKSEDLTPSMREAALKKAAVVFGLAVEDDDIKTEFQEQEKERLALKESMAKAMDAAADDAPNPTTPRLPRRATAPAGPPSTTVAATVLADDWLAAEQTSGISLSIERVLEEVQALIEAERETAAESD